MTDFSKMSIDTLELAIETDEIGIRHGRGLLQALESESATGGLRKVAESMVELIDLMEQELAELRKELASRQR
jgi:hypothetical protein